MKSQFDPDVWAALFMIMIIGFGGLVFLHMFVNSFVMHGILQIFDQEVDQRCSYFLLPASSNDYYFSSESGSKYTNLTSYYVVNPPQRESFFDDFMSKVAKNIKGLDIGGNETVNGVCWGMGNESTVDDEIQKCENKIGGGKGVVELLDCSEMLYGPSNLGIARVVFVG